MSHGVKEAGKNTRSRVFRPQDVEALVGGGFVPGE